MITVEFRRSLFLSFFSSSFLFSAPSVAGDRDVSAVSQFPSVASAAEVDGVGAEEVGAVVEGGAGAVVDLEGLVAAADSEVAVADRAGSGGFGL